MPKVIKRKTNLATQTSSYLQHDTCLQKSKKYSCQTEIANYKLMWAAVCDIYDNLLAEKSLNNAPSWIQLGHLNWFKIMFFKYL